MLRLIKRQKDIQNHFRRSFYSTIFIMSSQKKSYLKSYLEWPLRARAEIKNDIYLVIFLHFGQPPAPPRKRASHTTGQYLFTCFLLNKGGIDEEPNVPYVTANCGRKDAQLIMTDLSSAGYCFNSTSSVVQCACQSLQQSAPLGWASDSGSYNALPVGRFLISTNSLQKFIRFFRRGESGLLKQNFSLRLKSFV